MGGLDAGLGRGGLWGPVTAGRLQGLQRQPVLWSPGRASLSQTHQSPTWGRTENPLPMKWLLSGQNKLALEPFPLISLHLILMTCHHQPILQLRRLRPGVRKNLLSAARLQVKKTLESP